MPGNSSSLDTFQELLSRARAAGEYTTDAGRHSQHFLQDCLHQLPFQKRKGEISCRPTPWLSFLSTALPSSPFWSLLASRPPRKGDIFSRKVEILDFEAGAAWSNHATKVVSRSQERTCSREWTRTKQVGFHRVAILGAGSRKKEDKQRSEKKSLLQANSTLGSSEQAAWSAASLLWEALERRTAPSCLPWAPGGTHLLALCLCWGCWWCWLLMVMSSPSCLLWDR